MAKKVSIFIPQECRYATDSPHYLFIVVLYTKSEGFMKVLLTLLLSISASTSFAGVCAKVYQGKDFSGAKMVLHHGDSIRDLNDYYLSRHSYKDWDNRISSLKVKRGCTLSLYQYQNFGRDWGHRVEGKKRVFTSRKGKKLAIRELTRFNDLASSLECFCR